MIFVRPLLCELRAHTRWSDGDLSVAELVDVYGESGFNVLCLIPCERNEEALVEYPRSSRPVYLTRLEPDLSRVAA